MKFSMPEPKNVEEWMRKASSKQCRGHKAHYVPDLGIFSLSLIVRDNNEEPCTYTSDGLNLEHAFKKAYALLMFEGTIKDNSHHR